MNRELKFRFWNKLARRFQPPSKYAIDGEGKLVAYDYEVGYYDDPIPFSQSCIVPQQYTGLKDKNGKDIYEGDIVRGEFFDEEYRRADIVTHEVVFYGGAFNIASSNWHKPTLEIIGNIFETPELLK